jgi:hypothetical protein
LFWGLDEGRAYAPQLGGTGCCSAGGDGCGIWHARAGTAAVRFEKPITIVVTFPPGGGTDLLARRLGAAMQQRLGQSVVVENRPGASGNIGASAVAEAAPDGATLLMVNSSFAINPGVYRHLDFDPRRDFKAVFNVGSIASVLVVPAKAACAICTMRWPERPLASPCHLPPAATERPSIWRVRCWPRPPMQASSMCPTRVAARPSLQ